MLRTARSLGVNERPLRDRIVAITKVRKSKTDRSKTAQQKKTETHLEHGISVPTSTTQRRLRETGLFRGKPGRKPKLMTRHKNACLQFPQAQMGWTAEQWSRVVFSNKSKFLLHRSNGRVYVRQMAGEEFKDTSTQQLYNTEMVESWWNHGGIMVWGCINARGVGSLSMVAGRFNRERHIDILENALIPTTHFLGILRG